MLYGFLSKIFNFFHLLKGHLIAFTYYFTLHIFFRKLGSNCCFQSFLRFGYVFRNIQVGNNCYFGIGLLLNCGSGSHIIIGDNVSINDYTFISSLYNVEIGDNTRIGEFVSIRDNDHSFTDSDVLIRLQGFSGKPIKIGSDVWIGRGVFIGKGVEIGDGAVIGANSVVTKSIPPFAVAVGSPAKVIKYRIKQDNKCLTAQ